MELDILREEAGKYGLRDRIKSFVLETWDFADSMPQQTASARNAVQQVTRAASSVGANFRAAFRGRSRKEYIAKLGIAEEEADECCYWLDLIASRPVWHAFTSRARELEKEADQITAIIVSLIKKAKQR